MTSNGFSSSTTVPGAPVYTTAHRSTAPLDAASVTAFVLALCSPFLWVVPAVVALLLAPGAKRNIAAGNGALRGKALATAAQVISLIVLLFTVVFVGIVIAVHL